MAADVDCTGHTRDMGRQRLDIHADGCGPSAESLRPDAELVDLLQHLILQLCIERIFIVGINRTKQRLLRKKGNMVKVSSDADSYYDRRTGIRACLLHSLDDEVLRIRNPSEPQ